MKLSAIFAVAASGALSLVVACSSSSSGGGSPPTCKNPQAAGPGSAACNTCLESNCGSQLSAASSACSAYESCYAGCDCSDFTCIANCAATKIDMTCQNGGSGLISCQSNMCSSQCTGTIGGTDAGGGGDTGATE
jgi:hypothetical protein